MPNLAALSPSALLSYGLVVLGAACERRRVVYAAKLRSSAMIRRSTGLSIEEHYSTPPPHFSSTGWMRSKPLQEFILLMHLKRVGLSAQLLSIPLSQLSTSFHKGGPPAKFAGNHQTSDSTTELFHHLHH